MLIKWFFIVFYVYVSFLKASIAMSIEIPKNESSERIASWSSRVSNICCDRLSDKSN